MQEIELWLQSNQDYSEGVQIFNKYSGNQVVKKLFQHQENQYRKNKLIAELSKLLKIDSKINIKKQKAQQHDANNHEQQHIADVPKVAQSQSNNDLSAQVAQETPPANYLEKQGSIWLGEWSTLPDDVRDCINAIKDQAKERDLLRHRLEDMQEGERAAAAQKIVALDESIENERAKLAEYKETGVFPNSKATTKTDVASIMKRIATLKTYVSRDKNKPDKLINWQNELKDLELKLNS